MAERKPVKFEQMQDVMSRLYPELHKFKDGSTANKDKTLSRNVTFQVSDDCNLRCKYCLSGDTQIRMVDYSLKEIKDIEVGDEVLGFDEYTERGKNTKVKKSTVEQLFHRTSDVIELVFENGEKLKITPNHKILVMRNSYDNRYDYKEAGKLKVGDSVYCLPDNHKHFLKRTNIVAINQLGEMPVYNIGTTTHTYISNSICVHNCYQINKGKRKMSLETAKDFIDFLLSTTEENCDYINPTISPFIILEFIGGEPLLEVDLIDQIMTYWRKRTIELQHPWADKYYISICSNGTLYFQPNVQRFLQKYKNKLSFSVTLDGNKELHDSCRVFPDGSGSYDLASAACKDWMSRGNYMGSKITIAPTNVTYLFDAIKHMIDLGYNEINANCVYEKGWEENHATELYKQMNRMSDYILDNDLEDKVFISLYGEGFFRPKEESDLDNWCFRGDTMILTPNGNVPISELKDGDKVVSGNDEIRPITVMKRMANDGVLVKASGIYDTYTTYDHPYFTKPFSYIGYKSKYKYKDPQWIKAGNLKKGDKIALYKHKFGDIDIDESIAYALGYYIGDGWKSNNLHYICCAYDKTDYVKGILDNANIEYTMNDHRTVREFYIKKSNVEFVTLMNQCGENAMTKHIPQCAFNWNESSVRNLMKGYLASDGYLKKQDNMYKINTISSALANDVMLLLRGLGYFPTCHLTKRKGKSTIEGRTVNINDRYEIYFYIDNTRSRYCLYDNENDVIWTTVRDIEDADPYEVYNLTVDQTHTFIANGVIVHNCGGNGMMLSCDPDGYLYPCIRFMESSLSDEVPPIRIGTAKDGIGTNKKEIDCIHCMDCINRRTKSTDECFYCPIAEGCSDCAAYNYQDSGKLDSHATYICIMHKARSLANVYYWNKYYKKKNIDKVFKMYCPKDWATPIIGEKEYKYLKELSREDNIE
jgi:radical SAM peptide maturase (CXXX-repeat target family)